MSSQNNAQNSASAASGGNPDGRDRGSTETPLPIERLLAIMAALRTPVTGCPWDLEQDFDSIAPYTVEEAYEVADAIARGDFVDLKDELGDLLLQVVFHARLAQERGLFDFSDIAAAIVDKLVRRHPHVFGDAKNLTAAEVKGLWATIKRYEKIEREAARPALAQPGDAARGQLSGVTVTLPGLTRAVKLQQKAAEVGFDWNDAQLVLAKVREETEEIAAALDDAPERVADEIGDLLFAVANLARHVRADPESTLRRANAKFERRFRFIETSLSACGKSLKQATLAEMEALWQQAKRLEDSQQSA
jgi:nucleoside triphosphate diphosphatase